VSQIFDALRDARHRAPRAKPPRTAQGDAVLTTLGYPGAFRESGRARGVSIVAVIVAAAVIWAGWRLLYQPAAPSTSRDAQRNATVRVPSALPKSALHAAGSAPTIDTSTSPKLEATAPAQPLRSGSSGGQLQQSTPTASTEHMRTRPRNADRESPAATVALPAAAPIAAPTAASAAIIPPTPRTVARPTEFELAVYYHRAGDFENALQHYRAVLQQNELNGRAHNNLGLLYQEKNLLTESARELQRAVILEPRNADAHNNYGVTLLMQAKPDEADAEFRAALALERRNGDALVNLALAQRDRNQLDLAKETLLEALALAPRSPAAHYNLAQLYDQTHEATAAIEHYRRFLDNAGAEHSRRAAAVRARIAELLRTPE
jgi:Tfp pilus assembly protein PilF